ncbi:MAG: hypothetical protein KF850_06045 [Labilithrix sp.]|nr:hypothetical protein [Labilithrix sp.]
MSEKDPRSPAHRGSSDRAEGARERSATAHVPNARVSDEQARDPNVSDDVLPDDLVWAGGGHASDVVLTALADGQRAIVPEAARAHVERCTICATHLGHAALLSLHAGAEIAARAEHDRVLARRPLPRLAIALGLAVAALGLLPSLLDADAGASTVRTLVTRDVPLFLAGLGTLARRLAEPGSSAGLVLTYATAALLVLTGLAVVRFLPRTQKETTR